MATENPKQAKPVAHVELRIAEVATHDDAGSQTFPPRRNLNELLDKVFPQGWTVTETKHQDLDVDRFADSVRMAARIRRALEAAESDGGAGPVKDQVLRERFGWLVVYCRRAVDMWARDLSNGGTINHYRSWHEKVLASSSEMVGLVAMLQDPQLWKVYSGDGTRVPLPRDPAVCATFAPAHIRRVVRVSAKARAKCADKQGHPAASDYWLWIEAQLDEEAAAWRAPSPAGPAAAAIPPERIISRDDLLAQAEGLNERILRKWRSTKKGKLEALDVGRSAFFDLSAAQARVTLWAKETGRTVPVLRPSADPRHPG